MSEKSSSTIRESMRKILGHFGIEKNDCTFSKLS